MLNTGNVVAEHAWLMDSSLRCACRPQGRSLLVELTIDLGLIAQFYSVHHLAEV